MCSVYLFIMIFIFFFKQKTAYEMRISDWSSDVCSSDLGRLMDWSNDLISWDCENHANRAPGLHPAQAAHERSEEHTSELQSLMRISYAVFCLKKKTQHVRIGHIHWHTKLSQPPPDTNSTTHTTILHNTQNTLQPSNK